MLEIRKREKELIKKLFAYPVFLSIFSVFATGILIFILIVNYEKKDTAKNIEYILKQKKHYIKEKVLDISNSINLNFKQLKTKAKNRIEKRVENLSYQLLSLYNLPLKNKRNLAIKYLNNLNKYFNNIFVYDAKTGVIYVCKIASLIGKNTKSIFTKSGISLYEKNKKIIKNGGFYEIYNNKNKKLLKIEYLKSIPQFNLIIGSEIDLKKMKNEIIKDILYRIRLKRFDNGNYFFVLKPNGILLVNPSFSKKIGQNVLNLKDIKGKYFIKEIISKAMKNKNGAFVTYYWFNPETKKEEKKISFVLYNKNIDAIIGSGLYYKKDIQKFIQKEKNSLKKEFMYVNISIILSVVIMSLIALILSSYFSKKLKNIFDIYNKRTTKLLKKITFEATHDTLTKVPNRKYFNEKLKKEFYRAKRYKIPLSIAMLDIDYFKKINDTYGHDAGDIVLKKLADFCHKNIRKSDFFARWGGEEFMFIFPHTDLENAIKICKKIKNKIQSNPKIQVPVEFTISCGVTQLKENDTIDSFLKRVDDALYRAKENGRDRIEAI